MTIQQPYGVYGYRFQDPPQLPIFQLFATGYQRITEPDYYWDGMKRIDGPLYLLQYTVSGGIVRSLQRLYAEAKANRIQNSYQASSLVYQLLMELLHSGTALQQERANWPQPIRQAAAYIEAAFERIQSLDDIASSASLSKYYFTRMFAQTTGLTPMDYVTKLRIEKTVELLRFTALSVEEIAAGVGYSSGSYFSKVFRSRVGFPPGDFRLAKGLPSIERVHFD